MLVSEHAVMVEIGISEIHQNSFFIFHSRSSSLESSATIRIITGEEELSQPDKVGGGLRTWLKFTCTVNLNVKLFDQKFYIS